MDTIVITVNLKNVLHCHRNFFMLFGLIYLQPYKIDPPPLMTKRILYQIKSHPTSLW